MRALTKADLLKVLMLSVYMCTYVMLETFALVLFSARCTGSARRHAPFEGIEVTRRVFFSKTDSFFGQNRHFTWKDYKSISRLTRCCTAFLQSKPYDALLHRGKCKEFTIHRAQRVTTNYAEVVAQSSVSCEIVFLSMHSHSFNLCSLWNSPTSQTWQAHFFSIISPFYLLFWSWFSLFVECFW